MKLHLAKTDGMYSFTAHGPGYVTINGTRHTENIALTPMRLLPRWTEATFDTLAATDLAALTALDCEILLLGTGSRLRFPAPELLQPLMAARIGVEVMDTPAACRTFNILASEGRRVAAALLID